jgi:hypothetical protein
MSSDLDLLFGVLVTQADLITADQLAEACAIWSARKAGSLPDILCERGWLVPQDQAHVEYLVARRLAKCGEVKECLAGCPLEIRCALASVGDRTIDAPAAGVLETSQFDQSNVGEVSTGHPAQRYTLSLLHAAGGIGEIWLARDAHLHREVAVNRLQARASPSEAAKRRFLREARITGQLDHPGSFRSTKSAWMRRQASRTTRCDSSKGGR